MDGTPPLKAASCTFHTAAAVPRLDLLAVLPRLARHATPGDGRSGAQVHFALSVVSRFPLIFFNSR